MTTFQIAHTLARHTSAGELPKANASLRLEVLQAINAALQKVYRRMPAAHKITTLSLTLKAQQTVAVELPNRYTNFLTAPAFTAAMRGCTVFVTDDPQPNEIVAPNALLDEFTGNALSGNAVVHSDAIPIFDVIERLAGDPHIYRAGQVATILYRAEMDFDKLPKVTGRPARYRLEPCGTGQGADPEFILRVWPMPDAEYKVRLQAELATARITFEQVTQTAVDLPLNERLCESVLLPVAIGELTASPDWRGNDSLARERADRALAEMAMPGNVDAGFNEIGTAGGY